MKSILLLVTVIVFVKCDILEHVHLRKLPTCCNTEVRQDAVKVVHDFSMRLFKTASLHYNSHFVLSTYSVWLALAALAEGSTDTVQHILFKALGLPEEECLRQKYYATIRRIETSCKDVKIDNRRFLAIDETVKLNGSWTFEVFSTGLLDTGFIPIKMDTQTAAERIANVIDTEVVDVDFSGNSVLIESLDYNGLWTTSFSEAEIEQNATFYNDFGVRIGNVDLLHIKKRVKLAYLPKLNSKVLELPVGIGGRYSMLFLQNIGKVSIRKSVDLMGSTIIADIIESLKDSAIPLEIAIPKINFTSVHDDFRYVLDTIGFSDVFDNNNATAYVSTPPALPSSYLQRASINIDGPGVEPNEAKATTPIEKITSELKTGLASAVGRDFICNRPFFFWLVETSTNSVLFGGSFSKPYLL